MPNNTYNHVRFVGSDESIKSIKSFIKSNESEFDFNKVIPMPDELKCDEEWDLSEFIMTCPNVDIEKIPVSEYKVVRSSLELPNGKKMFTIDQVDENNKIVMRDLVKYEYDGYYLVISKEELSTLRLLKSNMLKYGYPSWYFWRLINWGSKWPAYNIEMGKDYCVFYTAWSHVLPIIVELSLKFPDVLFIYKFRLEEDSCKKAINAGMYIKDGMLLDPPDKNPDNPSIDSIPSKGIRIKDMVSRFTLEKIRKQKWSKQVIALQKIQQFRKYGATAPRNLSIKDNSVIGKESEKPLLILHPMDYNGTILNK